MFKIILILLSINILYASTPEITPQRMITDYNGIAYNDDIILCYGNYGIITFSRDLGDTWHRVNIGDKHNIKKIVFADNKFYGISDFHLLVSDDGIYWDIAELSPGSEIIDFSVTNDIFYFLKEDGIFILNNNSLEKLYDLDVNHNYHEILTSKEFLFILKNVNTLIRIDIITGSKNEFIIPTVSGSFYISELKNDNNILYARTNTDSKYAQSSYFLKSDYDGETWEVLHQYSENFSTYLPMGKSIFLISIYSSSLSEHFDEIKNMSIAHYSPYLKSLDLNNLEFNDITDKKINNPFRRSIFSQENVMSNTFSDLRRINDSIYIAVGKNNTIVLSYDYGKTFDTKSNFKNQYTIGISGRNSSPYILNNNTILTGNYKSDDGGITFKPRLLYAEDVDDLPNGSMQNYFFDSSGTGMILYESVISKTNNFGETFTYSNESIINNKSRSRIHKGISIGNEIIFTRDFDIYQPSPYTKLYFYDNTYNLKDSLRLDSILLKQIFKDNMNNLFALGVTQTVIDTTYEHDDYTKYTKLDYRMLKSEDAGKNWKYLEIDIPLKSTLIYLENAQRHYEYDGYLSQYEYNGHILFPNTSSDSRIMYLFDLESLQFKSIELPSELNRTNIYDNFFEFKNEFYYVSSNSVIYYTNNLFGDTIEWDSIDVKEYFHNWISKDSENNEFDVIYSAWSSEEQVFFTTTRRPKELPSHSPTFIELNFCKLFKEDIATSVVELPHTETRNYLYTYPPYPQPASTEVRSLVYWDTSLEMNTESVKIYNTNGVEVGREQDITFEQINAYSGNLIWNCNNVPDGVYLIQISQVDKKQTIKVMVRK